MMNIKIALETLKIDPTRKPSIEQIKKSYRILSLKHHPDRNRSKSSEEFLRLKEAYKYLIDLEIYESSENIQTKQPPPNELNLELTLEEFYFGCTKSELFTRKIFDTNGVVQKIEEKLLKFSIKPGSLPNTRITIPKEGDLYQGKSPANIVFVLQEKPHPIFKRIRYDLYYTEKISAKNSIFGCKLSIPTLENGSIDLKINKQVNRNTLERIPNRGFPYPNNLDKKGDLVIKFEIVHFEENESRTNSELMASKPNSSISKNSPIEIKLSFTLEEFINGCTTTFQCPTYIFLTGGKPSLKVDKIFEIKLKSGTIPGEKLVFPMQGHVHPGQIPGDIIFILEDKPHNLFKLFDGSNVEYVAKISQDDLSRGYLHIPMLDKLFYLLSIDKAKISDNQIVTLPGLGLPLTNEVKKCGDFLVRLEVSADLLDSKFSLWNVVSKIKQTLNL